MEAEILAKAKWIARLEKLAHAAGAHSGFFAVQSAEEVQNTLSEAERDKLRKAVLAQGAFRTLGVHVRHFERFYQWALDNKLVFWPLNIEVMLKYFLFLDGRGCGPTVMPSARTAVKWVASRLQLQVPDLDDPRVLALEKQAIEARGKELKEAVPFPLLLVYLLELFVTRNHSQQPVASWFIGWILCMIFASLRFDDALHVRPDSLEFTGGVLFGVCWQTKVDRKRRGSRFAVPQIGLSPVVAGGKAWLQLFLDLSADLAPTVRDFWMYEIDVNRLGQLSLSSKVASYLRCHKILKYLILTAIDEALWEGCELVTAKKEAALRAFVPEVTMHSCKVTMIDAAVHAGEDPLPISIQAHHANTDLVIKYTRNRSEVPLQMVNRLSQAFRESWVPDHR